MGIYTQNIYDKHGAHWQENLFYSHFLSLPLFLPFASSLRSEFRSFVSSDPMHISPSHLVPSFIPQKSLNHTQPLPSILLSPSSVPYIDIPKDLLYLTLNALTQYLCIRGVNLLSARTTALGVTI
ncbi:MAG: hypothetical protein Q9183_006043, partial [Haloplaca sp. 2 TL-2023]